MDGRILPRCNVSLPHSPHFEPRVYVIDVGISAAYGAVGKAALEIKVPIMEDGSRNFDKRVKVTGLYLKGEKIVYA